MAIKAEKEAAKAAKLAEKEAASFGSVPAESRAEKSERQLRWEAFLARHEKQNPAKHAERKAKGELPDEVPAHFTA